MSTASSLQTKWFSSSETNSLAAENDDWDVARFRRPCERYPRRVGFDQTCNFNSPLP